MMKILKITNFEDDMIGVEIEGYKHAIPTFDIDISKKDLILKLKAWKVNQDKVDLINKTASAISKEIPHKDLEGKEI